MEINKNKLFDNLKDIKNLINLNIMKCYIMLLLFNNIIYNVGSLIIICIIFFHIIFIFWFYINQLEIIKKRIKNILYTSLSV